MRARELAQNGAEASASAASSSSKSSTRSRERSRITLFRAPIMTLYHFSFVLAQWIRTSVVYVLSHTLLMVPLVLMGMAYAISKLVDGQHTVYVEQIEQVVELALWWIVLGILSSVGLGTGLHTFVLYLGPYIAKVTMAAGECKSLNFARTGPDRFVCVEDVDESTDSPITFWMIFQSIAFVSFLWGFGTAIGELPPYFVARAAARAGKVIQEVQELEDLEDEFEHDSADARTHHSWVEALKEKLFVVLQRWGFWAIVLCASVPNPLFDLAGVTCGHFGIPFMTFFSATVIGKAAVKVAIQATFVITMFHRDNLEKLIETLEMVLPSSVARSIDASFRASKANFHRVGGAGSVAPSKTWLSYSWDAVLILMLGFFLKSIIESAVHERLKQLEQHKHNDDHRKKKSS